MAIKGNRNIIEGAGKKNSSPSVFSKEEAMFVASKIQQANFKGIEFETYQKVMIKLKQLIDKG